VNRSFPALRGLAILLVVLNHAIHMTSNSAYSQGVSAPATWEQALLYFFSGLGAIFAVPIFLYLSGAFFAYAATKDDLKSNYKVVWNNVKHVAIPYLIWSILFYIEIYFLHDKHYTLLEYVKHLIVGYPFNFVPLLIFYYLISPVLIRLIRYTGWGLIVLIGLYQLVLLNIVYPGILGFEFPGWMGILAPPVLSSTLAEWAIFFPLGLIYVKKITSQTALVEKTKWVWAGLTVVLYLLAFLDVLEVVQAPLARFIAPVTFMLLASIFKRNAIPYVKQLEVLGKKAYGLYLMNLLILDILLTLVESFIPGVLAYYLLLIPLMFALALLIPLWIINGFERLHRPVFQRYVFG
jgi:fucose 4-O-acetylase-like acetyltransferase